MIDVDIFSRSTNVPASMMPRAIRTRRVRQPAVVAEIAVALKDVPLQYAVLSSFPEQAAERKLDATRPVINSCSHLPVPFPYLFRVLQDSHVDCSGLWYWQCRKP